MSLTAVFMGTPEFALPTLARLLADGHRVAAAYTQPPRPAARGLAERRSPVHEFAAAHGIEVRHPASLRPEPEQDAFLALAADVAVVVAYGLILPKRLLDAPRHGCLNLHASLLPRWRGAAPIQRAVMAGDAQTGVCVMQMVEALDAGPVCARLAVGIDAHDTAGRLHDRLAEAGAELMAAILTRLDRGEPVPCTPQPEDGVTYAAKIAKDETRLDFARPSDAVLHAIHGLSPRPGAWFAVDQGGRPVRVRILAAELAEGAGAPGTVLDDRLAIACRDGAVRPLVLQREGKAELALEAFLRGMSVAPGTRLG